MPLSPSDLPVPVRLDLLNACLWRGAQRIALRPKTFAVLQCLLAHPGQLVTKATLLDAVWPETTVNDVALMICISELRRVLGDDPKAPRFIETMHRRGYRFVGDLPVTAPPYYAAVLHRLRREGAAAQERVEAALALMTEQGFGHHVGPATFNRGWALAVQGQCKAGMAQMHQGLAAMQTTGDRIALSTYLAQLAEAYGNSGQVEEGLRLLAEALAHVDHTGARYYEAEVYRVKGELLLRQAVPDAPQAEACFQQSLAVALRQQARSWELRSALSLSRLWRQQGKRAEARELLAPIYSWFTEGFDTPDLQEARALLDELA